MSPRRFGPFDTDSFPQTHSHTKPILPSTKNSEAAAPLPSFSKNMADTFAQQARLLEIWAAHPNDFRQELSAPVFLFGFRFYFF